MKSNKRLLMILDVRGEHAFSRRTLAPLLLMSLLDSAAARYAHFSPQWHAACHDGCTSYGEWRG